LSSIDSANSFFNRQFSSSIALSRFASDASIPPYLAFHLMGWTAPTNQSQRWLITRCEGGHS
jgi:hypothetical protein